MSQLENMLASSTEARRTGSATERSEGRRSPIDEILAARQEVEVAEAAHDAPAHDAVSRYGDGASRRRQQERDEIAETYLAMDVRLRDGEYCGLFYMDLAGSPRLSPDHTMLTVPFRTEKLIVRGFRLEEVFRAILHNSLDILQESHRPEFMGDGNDPVIESIEIVSNEGGH